MSRTIGFLLAASGLVGACAVSSGGSSPAQSTGQRDSSGGGQTALMAPFRQTRDCSALTGMKVEAGIVESAVRHAADGTITDGVSDGAKAQVSLCRVRLRLRPVSGSDIRVEVWLPEAWNERLMGFGGGGFDGSLNPDSWKMLNPTLAKGYAAVVTDVGHTPAPTPGTWIHKQPEKVVDFGHRGTHLAAVVAKQIVSAFYGTAAKRAYFQGCSNGGRDGLSLASRYPEDYDAIIAGAPAARYVEVVTQLAWYSSAASKAPKLTSKLDLLHKAVLNQCDKLDGVQDGILENPSACRFDPAVLQCKSGDAATCLNSDEVDAVRKIYSGPKLSNGEQVMAPPALGSEGSPGNWAAWVTGPIPGMAAQEFYRWMVFDDPTWTLAQFDLDRDYEIAREQLVPIIDSDNPDLRSFIRRGGKLIIYQGWDDPAITPGSTLGYFQAVRKTVGPAADRQVRLFMVPGMAHCGGGPGATSFDMLKPLEDWVERGISPERIHAIKPDVPTGQPPFSRPLCPWPKTARYTGSGSIRDAANFTCVDQR